MIITLYRDHAPGAGPADGIFYWRDADAAANSPPHPASRGVTGQSKAEITRAVIEEARAAGVEVEALISAHSDKHATRAMGVRWIDTRRRRGTRPGDNDPSRNYLPGITHLPPDCRAAADREKEILQRARDEADRRARDASRNS